MRMRVCLTACVRVYVGVDARAQTCACACVALLIQHTTRIRHTVCGPSLLIIFFDIFSKTSRFPEKKLWDVTSVFLILRRIQRGENVSCKVAVIFVRF